LRRVSVVVVSVLLMVALAAMVAALPAFAKENGKPSDPNGFGTAASQIATNKEDDGKGGLGQHSRDPDQDGVKGEKREGIGNVARDEPDTDGSVGAHGCKQLAAMGGDCKDGPGKSGK
jgi:hypothetical protein